CRHPRPRVNDVTVAFPAALEVLFRAPARRHRRVAEPQGRKASVPAKRVANPDRPAFAPVTATNRQHTAAPSAREGSANAAPAHEISDAIKRVPLADAA